MEWNHRMEYWMCKGFWGRKGHPQGNEFLGCNKPRNRIWGIYFIDKSLSSATVGTEKAGSPTKKGSSKNNVEERNINTLSTTANPSPGNHPSNRTLICIESPMGASWENSYKSQFRTKEGSPVLPGYTMPCNIVPHPFSWVVDSPIFMLAVYQGSPCIWRSPHSKLSMTPLDSLFFPSPSSVFLN